MLQVRWPSYLAASFFFQAANSRAKRLRLLGGKEYLQTAVSSSVHTPLSFPQTRLLSVVPKLLM